MNRAEFIACSLAFHAALLVLAVLLPAPFPSQKAYTATDLTYVERAPEPERTEDAGPGEPVPYAIPDAQAVIGRLMQAVPDSLSLGEGIIGMGERIRAAARKGAATQPPTPEEPPGDLRKSDEPAKSDVDSAKPPADIPQEPEAEQQPSETETAGKEASAKAGAQDTGEIAAAAAPESDAGGVSTARSSLNFRYQAGWPAPAMIGVDVKSGGPGGMRDWTAKPDGDWIMVTPENGTGDGRIMVGVMASGMDVGYHEGGVLLAGPGGGGGYRLAVSLMVLPEDPGKPELPHLAWDDYMDGGCQVCHLPKELMPSADFMSRPEFCGLCHNPAGMASESLPGPGGHPVMVNVTSGGSRFPTGGTVATGAYSDKMSTHLLDGYRVVCVTCHNVMYKPGDYGRTWELASTEDGRTYRLSKGGWAGMGWLVPKVYVTSRLAPMPDRLAGLREFLADPAGYEYDEAEGLIKFSKPTAQGSFVYVTLSNPYLRAPTANNALCYDCHSHNTHQGMDCLVCHTAHGTGNIMAIRERIRTRGGVYRRVRFSSYSGKGSFAGPAPDYPGICQVCHTKTSLHNRKGGPSPHADGMDYTGSDCTACHTHEAGFAAAAVEQPNLDKP